MKKMVWLAIGVLLVAGNLWAADGDLIVHGNVGIGTDTPSRALDVNGNAIIGAPGGRATLTTWFSNTALWIDMPTTGPSGIGSGGAGVSAWLAYAQQQGHWFSDASAGDIAYRNTGGKLLFGNVIDQPAAMAITNNLVGIGTVNPSYNLHVNGTSWTTSGAWAGSDMKWKTNIKPLENSLDQVMKLQGVSYDWRVEEYKNMHFEKGKQVGLIAQDVEKVLPELVREDKEGNKAISYEKFTAVLLEAIKEQQKQISQLQEKIQEMEKKNN